MIGAGAGRAVGHISGITRDAALPDLLRARRRIIIDFTPGRGRHVWLPPETVSRHPARRASAAASGGGGDGGAPRPLRNHPEVEGKCFALPSVQSFAA